MEENRYITIKASESELKSRLKTLFKFAKRGIGDCPPDWEWIFDVLLNGEKGQPRVCSKDEPVYAFDKRGNQTSTNTETPAPQPDQLYQGGR